MTPHIQAKKGDFAKIVLMPGDPLRAKWIADNFLNDVRQVNYVRNVWGYTGTYQGKLVSVMAHGMGNPSIGIYSYELFSPEMFDVDVIIRVGSCGALVPELNVGEVVISESTYSESCYAQLMGISTNDGVLKADPHLVELASNLAEANNIHAHQVRGYASDAFYGIRSLSDTVIATQAKVVEMEAFALYTNAQFHHKKALALLTVSDSLVTHEAMSPEARATSFVAMIKLALLMVQHLS